MNGPGSQTIFCILVALVFSSVFADVAVATVELSLSPQVVELHPSGPDAPEVKVYRDDRVATLELDYVAGNPWTPFNIGADGLGAVGYRVSWTRLSVPALTRGPEQLGNGMLASQTLSKVTSLRRTQIQPLLNDVPYRVRVEYVNRLGQIIGDHSSGIVRGGNGERVNNLRTEMTAFFDDFNQPAGLPDERRWNTTFSKVNDPAFQAFFINRQFHSHTLVGTPADGYGDRGQTVHRIRTPIQIESDTTRRIVFDLDGVNIGGRTVWYLDLFSNQTDITSHFSISGGAGSFGHPNPGLRFKLVGQEFSVWSLNDQGEQMLIEQNSDIDWGGLQTVPNVRRAMEIQVSASRAKMMVDGEVVLDSVLGSNSLPAGEYTVHWTAFGYNTMKVNLPYMLLHWDNFGFDGPPASKVVHNYRSQVVGTDYVQSNGFQPQSVEVMIPDELEPTNSGLLAEARLHFTRQMSTFSPSDWSENDTVTVNGTAYSIPQPESTSEPPLTVNDLISSNAPYSSCISLGTVGVGGTAPLVQGTNNVMFQASQCGFHNVHIEISYPVGSEPNYTLPQEIHPIPMHHHFPKLGLPSKITRVGSTQIHSYEDHLDDPANFNPTVFGEINVGCVVNGSEFTGPMTLDSDFVSPQLAGNGENPGVEKVELWLRPDDGNEDSSVLLGRLDTNEDVSAPQVIHQFEFDTTEFANGVYELIVIAVDPNGIQSVPAYSGVGQSAGSLEVMNGYYFPLHVTINN